MRWWQYCYFDACSSCALLQFQLGFTFYPLPNSVLHNFLQLHLVFGNGSDHPEIRSHIIAYLYLIYRLVDLKQGITQALPIQGSNHLDGVQRITLKRFTTTVQIRLE